MGRYARDQRPQIKPVEKIQLSGEKVALRAAATVLLLLIGAGALAYAFRQLFAVEPGWQAIQAGTSEGATCGEDFTFLYELGVSGQSAKAESRALTQLYTQACRTAYQLFNADESFEGVVNLREINRHPNEVLEVDPALYQAFEAVQAAGNRMVYLGPVVTRYDDLFSCLDDVQLVDFDPRLNPEVEEEYAAIATYAADPEQVDMELLGENQVRLRVSEDYLAYAKREGIDRFLDFSWMKNAFIADYLADIMTENGYTCGTISSADGFTRCLDSRERTYGLDLLDWLEDRPIAAGTLEYQGPMSLVTLRSFPAAAGDEQRYYRLKNGEVRTLYLDPEDGLCRLDTGSITCGSRSHSCAELAMRIGQSRISDGFRIDLELELVREGAVIVQCWSDEQHLFNVMGPLGNGVDITNLYENEDSVRYTVDSAFWNQ